MIYNNETYIIRLYSQDLCEKWELINGVEYCKKSLTEKELIDNLKANGLEIIKYKFSSYGSCYLFKVKGEYTGNINFEKTDLIDI